MVSPFGQLKENFERQWQTIIETGEEQMIQEYIQATLETNAIAYAIKSLVNEGKGEITIAATGQKD
jgi:methionine synthase I (cobalamin-dependent)